MTQFIKKVSVVIISIFLLCSIVFALQLYGTDSKKNMTTVAIAATPSQVMTPEEFSKRVHAINQQTKTNLAQQVTETLPKQPMKSPIAQPPANTGALPTAAPTTTQAPQQPTSPNLPISTIPGSATVTTSGPANGTTPQPSMAPPSTPTSTVTSAPSSTQQNQTYTGFIGTGNTNTNAPKTNTKPKSSSEPTGWNIHY